ncbi:31543_t:CDS:2, partial [Racocetra persica]
SSSPLFLKTAATQMLEKLNQYIVYIYDEAAFIASVLDSRIKLELMPVNMNTSENRDFFNHIFQDYLVPKLNANMVSNTKKLSNSMTYIEQATSVPSEQIFSKAGDTIQTKRVCLSEKSIQALIYTGSWLEHSIRFQRD